MKGVVLAGGLGTRMMPLTRVTNKHLLPVYNRPMVFYPIQILVDAGIDEILLVTGYLPAWSRRYSRSAGSGRTFR